MKVQTYNFDTKRWEEKELEIKDEELLKEEEIVKDMDTIQLYEYHKAWISIINTINI